MVLLSISSSKIFNDLQVRLSAARVLKQLPPFSARGLCGRNEVGAWKSSSASLRSAPSPKGEGLEGFPPKSLPPCGGGGWPQARRRGAAADVSFLLIQQAGHAGLVVAKSALLRFRLAAKTARRFLAPPLPTRPGAQPLAALPPYGCGLPPAGAYAGLARGPRSCPARTVFTCPVHRPRRAAPCPPGTREKRRRRWRCGSSCRRSPAGPRRPRSRRRPRW